MSSKRHTCRRDLVPVHLRGRRKVIDPRFDEQFGDYDAKEFRQSYQFITDLRREELTVSLADTRTSLSIASSSTDTSETTEGLRRPRRKTETEDGDQPIGESRCCRDAGGNFLSNRNLK